MTTNPRPAIAIGTLVTSGLLPFARVLAASLRAFHPDLVLVAATPDRVVPTWNDAGLEVVPFEELGISDYRRFRFRYDAGAATIATKPYLLAHLLGRGAARAIILDGDTLVTGSLAPLLATDPRHSITVTPHRISPVSDPGTAGAARDLTLLLAGTFNAGCVAVNEGPEARRFLGWWRDRIARLCRHDRHAGLHMDQRWLDLVPAMFDGVEIQRDPGINVAYWNVDERNVRWDGETWRAGDGPCRLAHFSGFDPLEPRLASRHAPGLGVATLGGVAPLFADYAQRVRAAGYSGHGAAQPDFAAFDNGVPIPAVVRELYVDLGDEVDRFGDPFVTAHAESFFRWLREPDRDAGATAPVPRLWVHLHRRRPDVRMAYPDPLGAHREGFLTWARNTGWREHGLDSNWLPPPQSRRIAGGE